MARGRMLNKKISLNRPVNEMSDMAQLLYTWTIAHLDYNGVIHGDPAILKSIVMPRRKDVKATAVETYINEWVSAELAVWYECDGDQWLWFPKFSDNQIGLRPGREANTGNPCYGATPEDCRILSGSTPRPSPRKLSKDKLSKDKVSKDKVSYAESVSMTEAEHKTLVDKYGDAQTKVLIDTLDAYKQSSGKTYKSDAAAIRSWVIGKIKPQPIAKAMNVCEACGNDFDGDGKRCEKCK